MLGGRCGGLFASKMTVLGIQDEGRTLKTTRGIIFALFSLVSAVVAGQTAVADSSLATNPVYQKNCAKCHGKTADGRHFGGPSLTSDKVAKLTGDDLRNIISNGKGRMPKFAGKLTPEEINVLVQQIRLGTQQ